MTAESDLVRLSKLEAQFLPDSKYTRHVTYVTGSSLRERRIRKEELWSKEKELGRGGFAIVWLERCIQGDGEGKLRAVKQVHKVETSNYNRELEAIALFSHSKYEQCFCRSFGWFENDQNIYITMEYLPAGDLQKCFISPLPEEQGQQIVHQLLEGLSFMHEAGFAHRDLKPANILIKCQGPDWWVKIADFGISKRAKDGLTALRTQTGTPGFAAPEILGLTPLDDETDDSYTTAVDIWSLGAIAYFVLTGETLFKDQRRLLKYVSGTFQFPMDPLLAKSVSAQGRDFIKHAMAPFAKDRPGARECLQHHWGLSVSGDNADIESQRINTVSISLTSVRELAASEPSANWDTQPSVHRAAVSSTLISSMKLRNSTVPEPSPIRSTQPSTSRVVPTNNTRWRGPAGVKVLCDIQHVEFTPNGERLILRTDRGTIEIWNVVQGWTLIHRQCFPQEKFIASSISSDGKVFLSLSESALVTILYLETNHLANTIRLARSLQFLWSAAFSPGGRYLACSFMKLDTTTGFLENEIQLWHVDTWSMIHEIPGQAWAVSPDGERILLCNEYTVKIQIHEVSTGKFITLSHFARYDMKTRQFSPSGRLVALGAVGHLEGNEVIEIWEATTGMLIKTLKNGESGPAFPIFFLPDERYILTYLLEEGIGLWDIFSRDENPNDTLKARSIHALAFSPDGRSVACKTADLMITIYDVTEIINRYRALEGENQAALDKQQERSVQNPKSEESLNKMQEPLKRRSIRQMVAELSDQSSRLDGFPNDTKKALERKTMDDRVAAIESELLAICLKPPEQMLLREESEGEKERRRLEELLHERTHLQELEDSVDLEALAEASGLSKRELYSIVMPRRERRPFEEERGSPTSELYEYERGPFEEARSRREKRDPLKSKLYEYGQEPLEEARGRREKRLDRKYRDRAF